MQASAILRLELSCKADYVWTLTDNVFNWSFLQRVSIACYAERCISYDRFCLTDRPTVRLTV